jgi:3-oxoacyl-[acyl-carrier protein] reductase
LKIWLQVLQEEELFILINKSNDNLAGKHVLITGASRGIGAAAAKAFAAEGANITLVHFHDAKMTELAKELQSELESVGVKAKTIAADLSQIDSTSKIYSQLEPSFGPVCVLILNAGFNIRKKWNEYTIEEWDHIHAVNLRSSWLLLKEFYGDLKSTKGCVITVSSITSETAQVGSLPYVVSKAGVTGFTKTMARELGGEGIRVNSVMPGAIRTEWEVEFDPDESAVEKSVYMKQALLERGYSEDLAGTFLFLAGDKASFITGQTIVVDGGWVML